MDVAQSTPHEAHYHVAIVYQLSSLGNKKGAKGYMVHRLGPAPAQFPTKILYTPVNSTPLHPVPSVWRPLGLLSAIVKEGMVTLAGFFASGLLTSGEIILLGN